jgi:Ca-activated chloride channel homolog
VAAACLLAVAAPRPASAQDPEGPLFGFVDTYSVEVVLVPVVVRSRDGFVEGLGRERFRLQVGGRELPIETFERERSAPVSLVILQDLSGSMAQLGKLDASRQALDCLLDHAGPGDELALATFASGRTQVDVPFTPEVGPLREAVALWDAWGTTALHDAVSWLPEIAQTSRQRRRAALLITDGADNDSTVPPELARQLVQHAELPVYVLAMKGHQRAIGSPAEGLGDADLLRLLAAATGGRYHEITDAAQVPAACAAILSELRHQYVLGFSMAGVGERGFYPIRVELTGRGRALALLHRRGYHGTEPAAFARGR